MEALRQPEEVTYQPGDKVPSTGIYGVHHLDHHDEVRSLALITDQTFPSCAICGEAVRYVLKYAAPHILEDEDFHVENRHERMSIRNKDN
jgi:hypothetical protein